MKLVIYSPSNGEIKRVVTCHESAATMQVSGSEKAIAEKDDCEVGDTTHYVKAEQVMEKSPHAYTLTTRPLSVKLTGLSVGVIVTVGNDRLITDSQPTEIEFELPGTYTLTLSGSAPHLDETIEVTVNG